ncbi:MAG: 2-C-methyl-D-erythritol 4-phosphate cytidylyltransferase [Marmoricola sp.]
MLSDPIALGVVPDEGRGALPFALVYGEPLIAAATFAVEAADITVLDPRTEWTAVVETGLPLVMHDPLCPLTPSAFLGEAVDVALESDQVVVGVRVVTDTIKVDLGDRLGETVDRSGLSEVTSPIVLPARVIAELTELPGGDFASIVEALEGFGLRQVEAPAMSRRVRTRDDIPVLEALGRPSGAEQELLGHH